MHEEPRLISILCHCLFKKIYFTTYSYVQNIPGWVSKIINANLMPHSAASDLIYTVFTDTALEIFNYGKCPKISNTLIHTLGLNFAFYAVVSILCGMANSEDPNQTGMANSVDPDQTASSGAVWSGSALFAHAIFSDILVYEILGHLPKDK